MGRRAPHFSLGALNPKRGSKGFQKGAHFSLDSRRAVESWRRRTSALFEETPAPPISEWYGTRTLLFRLRTKTCVSWADGLGVQCIV